MKSTHTQIERSKCSLNITDIYQMYIIECAFYPSTRTGTVYLVHLGRDAILFVCAFEYKICI